MDDDSGLGPRDWGCYYEQPSYKSNLGLQLMSTVGADRDTKNLINNGAFLHRDRSVPQPPISMDYMRESWMHHRDKIMHMLPVNQPNYGVLTDATPVAHTLQMMQHTDPPKDDIKPLMVDDSAIRKDTTSKKRSQGRPGKSPKPKKPKKVPAPKDEAGNGSVPRGRSARKNTDIVINGIDLDISGIPTPVCTCTGMPQQCYRWGVGGWQSACCTTSMSIYPLPMSTKRRGARIAGRKMSQGAFKKVLEKLAGEGYNLSNPIDLRPYWAKHGTNKFVTIR